MASACVSNCVSNCVSTGSTFDFDPQRPICVATWNVLAPLMGGDKMFPGISSDIHSQAARRPILQRKFFFLNADVVLLQEIRKEELRLLLHEGDRPLAEIYESYYVSERSWRIPPSEQYVPPLVPTRAEKQSPVGCFGTHEFQTISSASNGVAHPHMEADVKTSAKWQQPPAEAERGAAVLWRQGFLTGVVTCATDIGANGPPCIATICGTVSPWNVKVVFSTAHLDGDSPVPAVERAQNQAVQVFHAMLEQFESHDKKPTAIIFGGDCNFTSYAPALNNLSKSGFRIASGYPRQPTCFSVVASARLDHIFVHGNLNILATEIPTCPVQTCCPLACFCHCSQVMVDVLGISEPKVKVRFPLKCIIICVLLLPWILASIFCYCLPLRRTKRRCRWALEEWGSDHLPVMVKFKLPDMSSDLEMADLSSREFEFSSASMTPIRPAE